MRSTPTREAIARAIPHRVDDDAGRDHDADEFLGDDEPDVTPDPTSKTEALYLDEIPGWRLTPAEAERIADVARAEAQRMDHLFSTGVSLG